MVMRIPRVPPWEIEAVAYDSVAIRHATYQNNSSETWMILTLTT
jgi:hypothetical protein